MEKLLFFVKLTTGPKENVRKAKNKKPETQEGKGPFAYKHLTTQWSIVIIR